MQNRTQPDRPLFRVTFSRITGRDETGRDILARPKEIGAVWPRKAGKSGGIVQLDIIPVELTQREGVIFLVPADGTGQGGSS
ncbi:MAG: hypothetical protein AAFR79_00705 [Pseudomonadota bacterium]